MSLSLIVAMDRNRVIGRDGDLPWRQRADLQRFKRVTMGHAIIMGRKTWDSIQRLLPGRTTIIVTRQSPWSVDGALTAHSLEEAVRLAGEDGEPFITGGAQLYQQALPLVDRLYLTRVDAEVEGDTYFPELDLAGWELVESQAQEADEANQFPAVFEVWERVAAG